MIQEEKFQVFHNSNEESTQMGQICSSRDKKYRGVVGTSIRKIGRFKCVKNSNIIISLIEKKVNFIQTLTERFQFQDVNDIWHIYMLKEVKFVPTKTPVIERVVIYGEVTKNNSFRPFRSRESRLFVSRSEYEDIINSFLFPEALKQNERGFLEQNKI